MARKLTQLTEVEAGDIGENALFYLVDPDRTSGDRSVGMTDDQVAALVGSSPTSTNPIENEYVDNAAMFADQGNQTTAFFQYVTGTDNYYEKLSTNTASISDYRLLSDTEIIVLRGRGDYNVVRLSDIQDDATPITSINGGRIGIEYDNGTDAVTGVFFNELLTDAIADIVALGTGNNLVLYNQDTGKYHVAEITAYSTVNTDYTLATLAAGMDRTEFSTNDRIRVLFDLGGTGGGGGGTVTSVAVSGSDGIEVDSGSPITTSGTIALGLNKANTLTFLNVEDGAEVNTINSDTTGEPAGSDVVPNIVSLTQAEYDAGTPVAGTFYVITDAKEDLTLMVAFSDQTTVITTGTDKRTFRMPFAMTLTEVRAGLKTADDALFTVDINEGGTSILSTKLTIDSGENTSLTAATPAVISDANIADDAVITIDVDTAGTAAVGGQIVLIGKSV